MGAVPSWVVILFATLSGIILVSVTVASVATILIEHKEENK